jgi:outer membrane immunogenic protein
MKKLSFIAAVAALIATPAFAADMAVKMPLKAPPPAPAPVNTWTGWYVGGNAGGAWGRFDPSTTVTFDPNGYFLAGNVPAVNAAGQQSIKPGGFTGGFELGYNWQAGNLMYGLEGDVESFHLSGSSTSGQVVYPAGAYSPGPVVECGCFTINSAAHTDWLATARGRVGVAANNWLFFATGGAAFTTLKGSFSFADDDSTESASISSTRVGSTVGGGVEVRLWANWSVKAEYLFVDFGRVSVNGVNLVGPACSVGPCHGQVFTHSLDLKANIARLGLNYQFP